MLEAGDVVFLPFFPSASLSVSSLFLHTSVTLLKTKGCSSAVEALCGQPESRSTYTPKGQSMKSPLSNAAGSRRWGVFRLALPREYQQHWRADLRGLVEDEGLQLRGGGALWPAGVEEHVLSALT